MISSKAGNWVDRGEPPDRTLIRVLSSYLHLDPKTSAAQLEEYARAVRGMAEADATEIHIAGYLKSLEADHGALDHPARLRRGVAIAVWHISKCAEVRDRAIRMIREAPVHTSSQVPLSTWLAERLMPGELGDGEPQ
jgi:hypothetical protein